MDMPLRKHESTSHGNVEVLRTLSLFSHIDPSARPTGILRGLIDGGYVSHKYVETFVRVFPDSREQIVGEYCLARILSHNSLTTSRFKLTRGQERAISIYRLLATHTVIERPTLNVNLTEVDPESVSARDERRGYLERYDLVPWTLADLCLWNSIEPFWSPGQGKHETLKHRQSKLSLDDLAYARDCAVFERRRFPFRFIRRLEAERKLIECWLERNRLMVVNGALRGKGELSLRTAAYCLGLNIPYGIQFPEAVQTLLRASREAGILLDESPESHERQIERSILAGYWASVAQAPNFPRIVEKGFARLKCRQTIGLFIHRRLRDLDGADIEEDAILRSFEDWREGFPTDRMLRRVIYPFLRDWGYERKRDWRNKTYRWIQVV